VERLGSQRVKMNLINKVVTSLYITEVGIALVRCSDIV
jgi:hypothetical protein